MRVQWEYAGRRITLVDTAGVKMGKSNKDEIDNMMMDEIHTAIGFSHVVAVLIDSMLAFTAADMTLIKKILDEGRAVVVIANKWDLI